jgi:hypothetical protein
LTGRSDLPDAEEPDPVKPTRGDRVEQSVWYIIKRGAEAELGEEYLCVDLVEARVHRFSIPLRYRGAKANTGLLQGGGAPTGLKVWAVREWRSVRALDAETEGIVEIYAQQERLAGRKRW